MDEMTTRRGTPGELDHWTMRDPRTTLDSLSTMDPRTILVLFVTCCLMGGVAGRPQPPVNITIVQKQTNFVIVSWDVPEGETIIGYAISQQQWKAGQSQRFIKEVNTTARTCTLWDLEPGNEYLLRVQALGLGGLASDPSPVLHFTTHQGSQLRVHGNSTDFGKNSLVYITARHRLGTLGTRSTRTRSTVWHVTLHSP
uniref:Fibronectin type III domain containing 4a n=1 Tax=Eptatretus burgeri TaxID=7764 RepID=A0A8C4QYT7_EPTBU